jgi:hypothetical protein
VIEDGGIRNGIEPAGRWSNWSRQLLIRLAAQISAAASSQAATSEMQKNKRIAFRWQKAAASRQIGRLISDRVR